jgi:hypothetical protein
MGILLRYAFVLCFGLVSVIAFVSLTAVIEQRVVF